MKRRSLLAALPALPIAALPAAATAAPVFVKVGSPIVPEHPWQRAARLAKELSETLALIRDTDAAGNLSVAVVHPAGKPYAVGFADNDSYDEGWAYAREFIREPGFTDPLATAIATYRKGCADYCALPDEVTDAPGSDAPSRTYEPPLVVLSDWDAPARTISAAMEAHILLGEEVEFLSDMGKAMFGAVGGYLLQVENRRRLAL